MIERLTIMNMLPPNETVAFDHNPERMKLTRRRSGGGRSRGSGGDSDATSPTGLTGTLGALFHGVDPLEIRITKARLVGEDCGSQCKRLLSWLSPTTNLSGAVVNGALGFAGISAAIPPNLIVQWGPPDDGTCLTAQLTKADVTYVRVTENGVPVHATINCTLQETPSPLMLTNPTSGGRPGRNRHVVHADETLHSIATRAFGRPQAWRAIAEVNGIDDPSSVKPGDVVYLPAPDELADLAAVAR